MELISQKMRKAAPELDPLRIGTGWRPEDLEKVQVMIESTFGVSHPGSGHLDILVEEVRKGILEAGGHGARYFCTDICDGESQGTDGINFSLASREMIANMIEIQANATPFDAGIYMASCDKGLPGNLMGLARVNIPAVVVTGGNMAAGPDLLTLEQLGMYKRFSYEGLSGHGWDGIMIAVIAQNNPKLVPFAALFVAYISTGADVVNRTCDVPIEIISIVQAVIIMFVAAERFLEGWKQRKIVQASQQAELEKRAAENKEGARER